MKARTMFRRPGCACRVSVAVVLLLSVPVVAFPGGIEIDCEGSRQAYKRDPNLRHLICTCSSPNASPKCTDPSSGSGSSGSSGGSQSSSRGSGGGSHMSSTNQAVLNGIREGLDAMFKPNRCCGVDPFRNVAGRTVEVGNGARGTENDVPFAGAQDCGKMRLRDARDRGERSIPGAVFGKHRTVEDRDRFPAGSAPFFHH